MITVIPERVRNCIQGQGGMKGRGNPCQENADSVRINGKKMTNLDPIPHSAQMVGGCSRCILQEKRDSRRNRF